MVTCGNVDVIFRQQVIMCLFSYIILILLNRITVHLYI